MSVRRGVLAEVWADIPILDDIGKLEELRDDKLHKSGDVPGDSSI